MVNYNPYLDETAATPSPIVSQSALFNLSKPIEYLNFGGAGGGSIKLPVKNYTNFNNTSNFNINFTFLEPFESSHVSNKSKLDDVGKVCTKTALAARRPQPYTLSKPPPPPSLSVESTNDDLNKSSSTNGIISRLSSISSTFKSIFVRPKHSKLVNISSINNKKSSAQHQPSTTQQNQQQIQENSSNFKLNLFSTTKTNENDINETRTIDDEFNINTKLEKIISRNVQKESYKSHLIRIENQLNDTDDEKCLPSSASSSASSSSSSSSSTISSLSTTSNLTTASSTTNSARNKLISSEAHQRAIMMTTNNQTVGNLSKPALTPSKITSMNELKIISKTMNNTTNTNFAKGGGLNSKWTCLVCLSMHKIDVRVCSICGSLQQPRGSCTPQLNVKNNASNNSSNRVLDLSSSNYEHDRTCGDGLSSSTLLKTININKNQSYLSKTWTCIYCSFANDCLKIVCMNCRSSKLQQHMEQENSNNKLNLSKQHHALQIKRKNVNGPSQKLTNGPMSNKPKSSSVKQNTSNEENELNNEDNNDDYDVGRNASKKSKCETCSNCAKEKSNVNVNKQPIDDTRKTSKNSPTPTINNNSLKNPLISSLSSETRILITPIKPVGYANLDAMLDANETNILEKKNTDTISASNIEETQKLKSNINIFAKNSNWTCSVCLVQNDESKAACACCSTAKPLSSSEKSNLNPQKLSFDQTDSSTSAKPSLASIFSTTTNTFKWACSTCLASNDAQKDECACCMTKRTNTDSSNSSSSSKKDEQETTKTKFASIVAAAGSFSNFNSTPLNTSISFGLKPSASSSTEPIKFGSSNSIGGSGGGFSFGSSKPVTATFGAIEEKASLDAKVSEQQSLEICSPPPATTISASENEPKNNNNENTVKFGFLSNSSSNSNSNTLGFNAAPSVNTGFSSFSTNSDAPKFGFGSTTSFAPPPSTKSETTSTMAPPIRASTTSFFGNSIKQETTLPAVTQAATTAPSPFAFGSNTNVQTNFTTSNNNATPSFVSNPFVKPNDAQKNETTTTNNNNNNNISTSFSTGSIANSSTTPQNPFQFGFSKSSNQIAPPQTTQNTPAAPSFFSNTNTASNSTGGGGGGSFGNGFGSNSSTTINSNNSFPKENQTPQANSFFGASSTSSNIDKPTSSTPFMFGSNNSTASSTNNNSSVFGALLTSATSNAQQQQAPASPFAFGKTSTTTTAASSNNSSAASTLPQPFVFGSSQVSNSSNSLSNSASNFNFGAVPSTPTTNNTLSTSNQSSPFVFSGIGGVNPNTDSPNLQQVLTPSTRLIKKPTRRIKK